jgi:predicted kinase
MKNYKLQKLTLVLMAGFPGTGKTTLALALGKALSCPIIDKDYLKESLLQTLTSATTEEELGKAVYEIVFAFAKALDCPIIDKDYLKESLLQTLTSATTEEELGKAVYEIVFAFAHDILVRQQVSVILDTAALYPFISERASNIARAAGAQLKIILCRADLNVRNERVEKKRGSIVQPHINTTVVEDDAQWFRHLPKEILVLYTARPLKEYINTAIDYLLA